VDKQGSTGAMRIFLDAKHLFAGMVEGLFCFLLKLDQ
jgi:hypothetical protein